MRLVGLLLVDIIAASFLLVSAEFNNSVPQGLKPWAFRSHVGTPKAVPFLKPIPRNLLLRKPGYSKAVSQNAHPAAAIRWTSDSGAAKTLREAAERANILVGTAVRTEQLKEAAYATTLAREYNMLEPEDAMKWEVVHPWPERFDFSPADRIVAFAAEHNIKVRGHTLVWHRQNPPWLAENRYSSAELSRILENHIKTVVGHYRGKVFAWDVANEAFDETALGKLRSTLWYDQPGIGFAGKGSLYLEQCFRWAHEADPNALLFYNEAEAEVINAKSDAVYRMVRDFRSRGVPIHGVGLQMHISNLHPDIGSISKNIGRFSALGVQVHITEMDVALPIDTNGNARPEDVTRQSEIYLQIAGACLAHPGCTAFQTWGFTDKYSWIGSHSRHTQGAALPFDRNYSPKPAHDSLREALETRFQLNRH
jgi:endo-1,4-beta-xylanase